MFSLAKRVHKYDIHMEKYCSIELTFREALREALFGLELLYGNHCQ